MARITRAAAHVSIEEVKSRLHNDPRVWCRKRWLIMYNALIDPRHPRKRLPSIAVRLKRQSSERVPVQVGHEVDDSTIYRLLARHGWRKLMPRPTHPCSEPAKYRSN